MEQNKSNNVRLIISILVAIIVILVMVIAYLLVNQKTETAKGQATNTSKLNSITNNTSNIANEENQYAKVKGRYGYSVKDAEKGNR